MVSPKTAARLDAAQWHQRRHSLATCHNADGRKAVRIADGDTLMLLVGKTQIEVRLEGIDIPERSQPFGQRARQALAKMVFRKAMQDVRRR